MFDSALNFIFGPLLKLPPLAAIVILSFLISLFIVIIYRLMTDQKEMKQLKESLSEYQKKVKASTGDPEKALSIQKEMMSVQKDYFVKSMKPTFVTMIPILLIFGWMNAHLAFEPLMAGQEFNVTVIAKISDSNVSIKVPSDLQVVGDAEKSFVDSKATFNLKGDKEGEYLVTLISKGQEIDKKVTISSERKYAPVTESYKSDVFKAVMLSNKPLKVFWKLSWLWAYIISAIIFSMVLRKLLKVY